MDPQTPLGLLAATLHSCPMSTADPLHEWYATSVHDPHMHAHVSDAPPPPPPAPPHGGDDDSSSSDESEVKIKKKKRGLYKVKNAEMRLPQYPNALTFQSWRRAVRTAAISSCEKPERARAFVFSVESEDSSFDSLAVGDSDKHRALDAKLAEALLKIVKGDLARRLAVMSESLAKRGLELAGRQILFLIYRSAKMRIRRSARRTYSHLEKMQGSKDVQGLETFLAVWDNVMLNFQIHPKLSHMYSAFQSKIRNIPELLDHLKKINRLPWDDPKKSYEALREECDFLIEETRLEKLSKQFDQLYENGSVATALAATPEEKKLLPFFYVRDGKPCPNDTAKKAKEEAQANKGKGKGKGKDKDKGKGQDKGKGKCKICPYFNGNKGCNHGSACKMLHKAPAMAARDDHTRATLVPKAKSAAAPKAAAADPSKP